MPIARAPKPARLRGLALVCIGLIAIFSPLLIGGWTISLFGAVIAVVGLLTCVNAYRTADRNARRTGFVSGGLATALGLLIFAGPNLVFSGVIAILTGLLAFEGVTRIVEAVRGSTTRSRVFSFFNGLLLLLTAAIVWRFHSSAGLSTTGIALGIYCLSLGWTQLIAPAEGVEDVRAATATNEHPDARLGLPPNPEFGRLRAEAIAGEEQRRSIDIYWMSVLVILFPYPHRPHGHAPLDPRSDHARRSPPLGDVLCAALLGALVILPCRLLWRRLTRPIERAAWTNLLAAGEFARASRPRRTSHPLLAERPSPLRRPHAHRPRFAVLRALGHHGVRPARRRLPRRLQPHLGIQLVLQHRELGQRLLGQGHLRAHRSLARRR